ncbi:MAG TPA: hydrogenase maturation protease, partial [Gemmataceae bacterium]|nr:hydrogenase maturation protease [Gemmataceae bacterium]
MPVLIAGVGNVLRGDDGFGVEVLRLLKQEVGGATDVTFYESGIAGIGLVQQLLDGYDALILLDALDRRAEPGT